ncbi:elongation of very long chain fatty acids protein 4-like [Xenia sp. Carnegie-2017]|uniref:elongation of very long chain fatty acids protein 4-like n=1 Tax=Xenia sp. Carnegie-2017 TaxID=2897299 RepID=UPI001F040060|nr:elongation of very long chain fatty acids protein 4-like [Xenia sp. Carnegie-2017]
MTFQTVVDLYNKAMDVEDPRTANWPLMSSPLPTLTMVLSYIIFVTFGPRLMRNRDAFNPYWLLVFYNFGLVILSFYMMVEILLSASSIPGFKYLCNGVDPGNHPSVIRLASACWLFYVSKFVEYLDTVFFVLRKKNNQITFLHVYHHTSVCIMWWIFVKWTPGGSMYIGMAFNSLVHVFMYSYYMVSALGPQYRKYLWWKKYLTSLQLIQFIIAIVYVVNAVMFHKDCTFPRWAFALLFGYTISLFLLFLNYYIKEYINRANEKRKLHNQ